jgi:hypothetical protein
LRSGALIAPALASIDRELAVIDAFMARADAQQAKAP